MLSRYLLLFSLLFACCLWSCEEKSYLYEVDPVEVLPNNAGKNKPKTPDQYVSVLYSNLYRRGLSPNQMVDLTDLITSIGDKQTAFEVVTAKIMTHPDVIAQIPNDEEMRADVEKFVVDTYKRFYVRVPTEAEKAFFINFIESNPNVRPEHVYYSFATSNEYYFY
jgi:hypothetical protein